MMRTSFLALSLFACASLAHAQGATAPVARATAATGRIHGIVFDSLIMKPVANATVTLLVDSRTATTDGFGQFAFDKVPAGQQPVAFSKPEIDSLGLGTLGAVVVVADTGTASTTLTTPSLRTLWTYRCSPGNSVGSDSGVVWGTVHAAANDSIVEGAGATFYWYDLKAPALAGLRLNQKRRTVTADGAGTYFACGLPNDVTVSTEGVSNTAASGRVEFTIGLQRVKRVDLLVSEDMVLPDGLSRAETDSALATHTRGRASLRGTVHDDKGVPLSNANVQLAASDSSVRSDLQGRFQMSGLPSGTQLLQVRRVGAPFTSVVVQLRPNVTVDVDVVMAKVTTNTLATSRIVAKSPNRMGYEDRRERGLGYDIDSTLLNRRADVYSALQTVPQLRLSRDQQGNVKMALRELITRKTCDPTVFVDGKPTVLEAVLAVPPDHYRAIEVLPYEMVPGEYVTPPTAKKGPCGAVLFWTKSAKW